VDKILFVKVKESINMQAEIYTAYKKGWTKYVHIEDGGNTA